MDRSGNPKHSEPTSSPNTTKDVLGGPPALVPLGQAALGADRAPSTRGSAPKKLATQPPTALLPSPPGMSSGAPSKVSSEDGPQPSAARIGFSYAIDKLSAEELPEFVKQNDTSLTFPEKLMLMLVHIEKMTAKSGKKLTESIGWTMDGTAFAIRNKEALTSTWLTLFFGHAKYSSFTRKLYRWGFRKINLSLSTMADSAMNPVEAIFGNENFRRDQPDLLKNMQSITAAKTRSGNLAGGDGGLAAAAGAANDTNTQLLQLLQGSLTAQASPHGPLSNLLLRQQLPQGAPENAPLLSGYNWGSSNSNPAAASLTPLQQLSLGLVQQQHHQQQRQRQQQQQQRQQEDNAMIQEYLRVLSQVPPAALGGLPTVPVAAPAAQRIAPSPSNQLLANLNLDQPGASSSQQQQQQSGQDQQSRERLATVADMLLRFGPQNPPPHS